MMLTKKQVLEAIEAMPEEKFTHINAIIEELILLDKIENGLEDMRQGQLLSEDQVNEVEDFAEFLRAKTQRARTRRISRNIVKLAGLWKDVPFDIIDEDVRQARRASW